MQLQPGTILDGKYSLLQRIGAGAAGAVYAAEHLIVGKRVAIKILDPSLSQNRAIRMSFVGEARAAAQIGHANVVDIYDLGVTDDGLTAVGTFGSAAVAWTDIAGLQFPRWSAVRAVTSDGERVRLPAVGFHDLPRLSAASRGRIPDPFAAADEADS